MYSQGQSILQDRYCWPTDEAVPDLSLLYSGVSECHGTWYFCPLAPYTCHPSVWNPQSQNICLEWSTCTPISETELCQ